MALEKWEIDLRKQLENTKARAVREAWEDDLAADIKDVPDPVASPKKKTSPFIFLTIIALLLGVLLYVYDGKTNIVSNWYNNCSLFKKCDNSNCAPVVNNVIKDDGSVKSLKSEIDKLKVQQEEIKKWERWNSDRITLLATVQQDNFLAVRNGNTSFIYFTADWEIEKMPQYLQLTEDDKAFLQKYLKK